MSGFTISMSKLVRAPLAIAILALAAFVTSALTPALAQATAPGPIALPAPPAPPAPKQQAVDARIDVSSCVKPEYPADALRADASGTTRIGFTVDAVGRVAKAEITRSAGVSLEHRLLDSAALDALSKCRFKPGTDEQGKPAGGFSVVDYLWTGKPAPKPQALAARIDVSSCGKPEYPDAALRADAVGTTKIRFTIDAAGSVANAVIARVAGDSREHRLLDRAALDALSKCRFKPGTDEQGKPVGGTTVVEYVWKTQ